MSSFEKCYGQHGWREFHRNRKNILAEIDKLLEQTLNRPVQSAHGTGAEAFLRKWLTEFLPKKFGVTSGYIIPDLYGEIGKIYHHDIIIYNVLESPVLWTEGNEDDSEQGKSRAIPVQHVIAVYEVKSRLTKKSITEALSKLNQIKEFEGQLNKNYSCGAIFIDLKETDNHRTSIIRALYAGKDVIGFSGGMVLRYEKDHTCTGLISFHSAELDEATEKRHCTPLAKPIDSLAIYLTEDGKLQVAPGCGATLTPTSSNNWSVTKCYNVFYGEQKHWIDLSWSRSNFSEFCIDLVSRLEGLALKDDRRPSFGRIFDSIDRKQARPQGAVPNPGEPFIVVSLHLGINDAKRMRICHGTPAKIEFWVQVENQGESDAVISDDHYKTSYTLPARKTAIKAINLTVQTDNFDSKLEQEGFEFPYRLVYRSSEKQDEFFAIEKIVKIVGFEISLF